MLHSLPTMSRFYKHHSVFSVFGIVNYKIRVGHKEKHWCNITVLTQVIGRYFLTYIFIYFSHSDGSAIKSAVLE